jgi:hypothetical protein
VLTPLDPSYVRGDVDKDEESHVTPSREVKVFVHCRMGISRSGSVIVAYGMSTFDAKSPVICGFC